MVVSLTSIDSIIVSINVFEIFDVKFNDLELAQLKVIHCKVMVPIESALVVFYLIALESNIVSHHFRDRPSLFDIRPKAILADINIFDFHKKTMGLYFGGKIGEDRWKIVA